jgi:sulfonate transport system permease protein
MQPYAGPQARRRIDVNIAGWAIIVLAGLLWEVCSRTALQGYESLPPLSGVVAAFGGLIASGELPKATLHTLESVLIGWSVSCILGVAVGIALGLSSTLRGWILSSLEVLRPLPAIAFLPLALLLFNFSLTTELVLIIYASIWPALINTLGGVTSVPQRLWEVARTLRLSRRSTIFKIVVPFASPAILTGCRLSLSLSLVMAIVAEMIGNPHGLGYAVASELQSLQPKRMFAYVIFIGLLAIFLNALTLFLADRILKGHKSTGERDA